MKGSFMRLKVKERHTCGKETKPVEHGGLNYLRCRVADDTRCLM